MASFRPLYQAVLLALSFYVCMMGLWAYGSAHRMREPPGFSSAASRSVSTIAPAHNKVGDK